MQYAYDDFDRHSHLPGNALQAHFAIYNPSFGSFGKPWWLSVTKRRAEARDPGAVLVRLGEPRAARGLLAEPRRPERVLRGQRGRGLRLRHAPIDNDSPPRVLIPALSHFDPGFEDPRTIRANLGNERELGGDLAAELDLLHARSDSLASNYDADVPASVRDAFGRPVYSGQRINPAYGPILVRASPARSDYLALTAALRRRFRDGVQFQAHYTWSRDRSNDDNERSGSLTLTDPTDPDYDWGLSIRDVPHRFVASGVFTLPFDPTASGIFTAQSGSPYTALDPVVGFHNHPGFAVGPHGAQTRAVVDGVLAPVNGERNAAWTNLDLRVTRRFRIGGTRVEGLFEVFNLLNTGAFRVGHADQQEVFEDDGVTPNPEFGLASVLVGAPRQAQLGLRVVF